MFPGLAKVGNSRFSHHLPGKYTGRTLELRLTLSSSQVSVLLANDDGFSDRNFANDHELMNAKFIYDEGNYEGSKMESKGICQ